ncbi:MAG: hypothetical protein WBF53_14190 [Litorimonas sp.]
MPTRTRLSRADRQTIVRERGRGVGTKVLAERFGVTERTIFYTVQTDGERRRERHVRSKVITVTVTVEEAEAFDAVLAEHGIGTRADGLRRLIAAANGIYRPEPDLAEALLGVRAALNRVGNNVTQIAKRLNEAKLKGMAPTFGPASIDQMRSLAGLVLETADQVDLVVRGRADRIRTKGRDAVRELARGSE